MCFPHPRHHLSRFWLILLCALLLTVSCNGGNPPAVSSGKVGILHYESSSVEERELGKVCVENKRRYAGRHGYEFVVWTRNEVEGMRGWKEEKIGRLCNGEGEMIGEGECETQISGVEQEAGMVEILRMGCVGRDGYWMMWGGSGALFVNQTVRVEDVVIDGAQVILSEDWGGVHMGVGLVKCGEWVKEWDGSVGDGEVLVKLVPKWMLNVYAAEYRAGDFVVNLEGVVKEIGEEGGLALGKQFEVLAGVTEVEDVEAFFRGQYMLNYYAGVCQGAERDGDCRPQDERRLRLEEPMERMAVPNRYRHVQLSGGGLWLDRHDLLSNNDDDGLRGHDEL